MPSFERGETEIFFLRMYLTNRSKIRTPSKNGRRSAAQGRKVHLWSATVSENTKNLKDTVFLSYFKFKEKKKRKGSNGERDRKIKCGLIKGKAVQQLDTQWSFLTLDKLRKEEVDH